MQQSLEVYRKWFDNHTEELEQFRDELYRTFYAEEFNRIIVSSLKRLGFLVNLIPDDDGDQIILGELAKQESDVKLLYHFTLNVEYVDIITSMLFAVKAAKELCQEIDINIIFSFVRNNTGAKALIESGFVDQVTHGIHYFPGKYIGDSALDDQIYYRFRSSGILKVGIKSRSYLSNYWFEAINKLLTALNENEDFLGKLELIKLELDQSRDGLLLFLQIIVDNDFDLEESMNGVIKILDQQFNQQDYESSIHLNEFDNGLVSIAKDHDLVCHYQDSYRQIENKLIEPAYSQKSAGDVRWFVEHLQIPMIQLTFLPPQESDLKIQYLKDKAMINLSLFRFSSR